jgi:hypothetical protein
MINETAFPDAQPANETVSPETQALRDQLAGMNRSLDRLKLMLQKGQRVYVSDLETLQRVVVRLIDDFK